MLCGRFVAEVLAANSESNKVSDQNWDPRESFVPVEDSVPTK